MTPQQIEALKLALEALKKCHYYMIGAGLPNQSLLNEAFTAYKALEALKEHAMQEMQRLGQEIEQKIGCVNHDCERCKAQRTEQNFCPRCGKRTKDIHTCTPPKENT
jgi:rRNA maturation endonuclease Nob1